MKRVMKKFFTDENNDKFWQVISCFIIFSLTFLWLYIKNVTEFIYDSWWYWTIGNSIIEDGTWSFLRFPETFRGYFLPFIFQIMKEVGEIIFGNSVLVFWIFTAVMLPCILVIILPYLFDKNIKNCKDCIRITLVFFVVFLFWEDYLLYPLSDMIAFALLVCGIALLKKIHIGIKSKVMKILAGMLAGICLYGSYNTRAAYLYGIVGAMLIFLVLEFIKRKFEWISVIALCVGILICATPQSIINHQYTESYSPKVYTEQYNNYQTGLEMLQVYWGFTVPNYLSYAGPLEEYPEPWVYFNDKVGEEILARESISPEMLSVGELVKLFIKYPQDMIGLYTRHLVALMTPMYLETYIYDMYIPKGGFLTLIITMWFVAVAYFLWSLKHKKINGVLVLNLLAIFFPCCLQLAGAPEARFFLPVHFVMYFYVLYYAEYKLCKDSLKRNVLTLMVAFLAIYILWIGVISDILKSNVHKTLLINDKNVYETQIESTDGK